MSVEKGERQLTDRLYLRRHIIGAGYSCDPAQIMARILEYGVIFSTRRCKMKWLAFPSPILSASPLIERSGDIEHWTGHLLP